MQVRLAISTIVSAMMVGCPLVSAQPAPERDPHLQPGGGRFQNDPEVVSPLLLTRPIYECAQTVVVNGYVPDAQIEIYLAGQPNPIGSATASEIANQPIKVATQFENGQVITAVQVVGGVKSKPSNAVTVSSYKDDYPAGLPQPRLNPAPCYDCGRAVGIADVIPGAWWKVFAEDPLAGGGFGPKTEVGGNADFAYTFVNPAFRKGQRITAQSGICRDVSPVSRAEVVQSQPSSLPGPVVDTVYEGAPVAVVRGPASSALLNGADIKVFTDNMLPNPNQVGGQPTPGGAQQIGLNPRGKGTGNYWATQALCTASAPGPKTPAKPCSQLPAAKIRQPLPGDTIIEVVEFVPGSRISIYAEAEEIGDGGGAQVALTRAIKEGEKISVVQSMGRCVADLVYVATAGCADRDPKVCSREWPAFRHSGLRDAQQPFDSPLADPQQVKTLQVKWTFRPPDDPRAFRASAIVHQGRVFIGNGNGRLYAIDAASGNLLWQYPKAGDPALRSQYETVSAHNPSSEGLPASASIGTVRERDAVIFGGPDQSVGRRLGSGRLFALDPASGAEIWKSPEIAALNGLTPGDGRELHENIGYSSPLVIGNRVYVGIANHADSPIQNGRVASVDINSGNIVASFDFKATSTRGGGIWSSLAGGLLGNAIYATTGNARLWNGGSQPQPSVDHSLSLLRLNAATGSLDWKLKPVPFNMDDDPDWASGPTLLDARCGATVASTQKDGWSYAARAGAGAGGNPVVRWQFPPTGIPFTSGTHGDTRYLIPGAAWRDTFITTTGGYTVEAGQVPPGFTRLHALDVCAAPSGPVRWVADIPGTRKNTAYQLGPPTVTRGIVFLGTAQGHLVVLADPSVWPPAGSICDNPEVLQADCVPNGFGLVPRPQILADIDLDPSNSSDRIFTEPVLADGRVFVATTAGVLYMLETAR
ncbi:PQQ-binding-like beta-propeller repeat protein [Bradyrhizobium sp. NBAIM01]|uniref:outer membrane protein assembly factor BamB family protein n=1 Tax=Bradyrhizobium sp. NBAIM01 TaxID=2793818 RepID=UPI001CD61B4A|nr:PQQ-binding-like beta-propeller repeat protein [Bradyrhizobium sp. NBAIM01]MCA1510563.1 PQQ-binding-like beta-propeller repeat protein [Bradyrhizobium sp. NBAIM01]